MNKAWIAFLSLRWFSGGKGGGSALRSRFAAAGIAAGVAALIVVLGVMNGLQGGYVDSILEVSSFHVRAETKGDGVEAARAIAALPGIRSALPLGETHVMALGPSGRTIVLSLRFLPGNARTADPGFVAALGLSPGRVFPDPQGIVLGSEAAGILGIAPGENIELLGVVSDEEEGLAPIRRNVRLSGTFTSGYYEFDSAMGFMDLDRQKDFSTTSGQGANLVGVKLDDRYRDAEGLAAVESALGSSLVSAQSWRDYNRGFFGALRTEKMVMLLLVSLIFIVVGVNIHHAMRRSVAVRMPEIAVLRAAGASARDMRAVFIADGLAVGLGGALVGTALGLLIVGNVNGILAAAESAATFFGRIFSSLAGGTGPVPAQGRVFYLDRIPVRVSAFETLFLAAAAALSACVAAGTAASRVLRSNPAEVLRDE